MATSVELIELKRFSLFKAIPDTELLEVQKKVIKKSFKKNSYIFKEGDVSDKIYFLREGTIKIGSTSNFGKEVIKFVIHPFAIFGELSMAEENYRTDFALSIDKNCIVYELSSKDFYGLMRQNPEFSIRLISLMGKKIKISERRLESMVFQDARSRIVNFIKENASASGMKVGLEILLKHNFTQQDIANFTGTSRQTVTHVLSDLKRTNKIFFKRKSMLIRNLSTLS